MDIIFGGEFPVKRVVNDLVVAEADIFCDGHDVLSAELHYKKKEDRSWQSIEMQHDVNDRWVAKFQVTELGTYLFTMSAWVDHFRSWYRDILKKIEADTDYHVDLLIGAEIIK